MTTGKRNVTVKQLPSSSDLEATLIFLQEVEIFMAQRRPNLVLDCSTQEDLDDATLHLMLHCLEEALKRNGDVRVAALSPRAEAAFTAARLGRLFDSYETPAEAVASFHEVAAMNGSRGAATGPLEAAEAA